MFVPPGALQGTQNSYFKLEGCPPGVPMGTNTKGTFPEGHFAFGALLCFIELGLRGQVLCETVKRVVFLKFVLRSAVF